MITLVYAYFNNGGMLDIHLKEWQKYKGEWQAIIVDDCSMRDPALPHIKKNPPPFPFQLYRINTDIPWNQNGARNLAMTHAEGWCMMTDMDHLLTHSNAKSLSYFTLDPSCYYRPTRVLATGEPYKHHPNSYVLTQDMYWKAGGYDERFCGYYGSDSTFRRQLAKVGMLKDIQIPLVLHKREVVKDASTTEYGRKGTKYHIANNPEIRRLKKDNLSPIPPLNFEWERLC